VNGVSVHVHDVHMTYRLQDADVTALAGVDLEIEPGDAVALLGPSGSGKSTLLTLLAGLHRATSGSIRLDGEDLGAMSERALLSLRSRAVGVVMQGPARNLLPYAVAEDNLRFAQRAVPRERRGALPDPGELLERLGLGHVRRSPLGALSGGEQQRLSLAVGLSTAPRLLLADEPTSQLDTSSQQAVIDLLAAASEAGTTVVVVTHDEHVAQQMHRTVVLHDGLVVGPGRRT
jgi:putative ABC transport system ATP-binding protein